MFQFTFWPSFIEIVRAVFEKKSKNCDFDHFFVLYGWTGFFSENPALLVSIIYQCLTSCQVSGKSLERILRSHRTDGLTDTHFDSYNPQLKLRNCNVFDLASTSMINYLLCSYWFIIFFWSIYSSSIKGLSNLLIIYLSSIHQICIINQLSLYLFIHSSSLQTCIINQLSYNHFLLILLPFEGSQISLLTW